MKKFWQSNSPLTPTDTESKTAGLTNLGYTDEWVEPDRVETLSGLPSLEMIPKNKDRSRCPAYSTSLASQTNSEAAELESVDETCRDYNIWEKPTTNLSRRQLLPYLLANLHHVEEVCRDSQCPYNRWLYCDADFPGQEELSRWEECRPQWCVDPLTDPASTGREDDVTNGRCDRGESTVALGAPLNGAGGMSEAPSHPAPQSDGLLLIADRLQRPEFNLTNSPAKSNLSQFCMEGPDLSDQFYPIITLPKSARKKSKMSRLAHKSSGPLSFLCCVNSDLRESHLGDKLAIGARPGSQCSCFTNSTGRSSSVWPDNSSSTCSCISTPLDPTAPHAFTVKDQLGGHPRQPPGRAAAVSAKSTRRGIVGRQYLPRCDSSCCATFTFILFCMIGLMCLLLYLHYNTNAMTKGMAPN